MEFDPNIVGAAGAVVMVLWRMLERVVKAIEKQTISITKILERQDVIQESIKSVHDDLDDAGVKLRALPSMPSGKEKATE